MIEAVSGAIWGPFMLTVLAAVGLYFTVGTGFMLFRRFGSMFTLTLGTLFKGEKSRDGVSPFAATSTALASCLGTGNIVGVASALAMGGPGALFWMWASAFLCMATKYAEVALAIYYRRRSPDGGWSGGPMYYMERGLGWKWIAVLFSCVCLVSTMGTGNLAQIGAMSASLKSAFNVPPVLTGAVSALIVGLTVFGGIKGVSRVAERLVPFISVLYAAGAFAVLFVNAGNILPVFVDIFRSAFGLKQAAGGAAGFTVLRAMRFGAARGVFSNEAGMGSSPMAHAAANTDSAARQGLWGALEVFIDTVVLCTLTGLVILVSGAYRPGEADTGEAFSGVFGAGGAGFVAASVSLFAIVSVMGWSCYGEACCRYLFGHKKLPLTVYRWVYLLMIPVGAVLGMDRIWALSDIANSLIMLPNLLAVTALSGKVFAITKREFVSRL